MDIIWKEKVDYLKINGGFIYRQLLRCCCLHFWLAL